MTTTFDAADFNRGLIARDPTLWPEGNVAPTRLGWLDAPRTMEREAAALTKWAETIDQDTVVILGMGGSSLGPLVLGAFATAFGKPRGRRLVVCDSTDPATVADAPIEDAFVIVSSKSGTTLEPNVLFAHARQRVSDPKRYAIITDPGTVLEQLGTELGVNRIFTNDPNIGGRYSVLSYFGLVPGVLAGYDVAELCDQAHGVDATDAINLGIAMAEAAKDGRDKATIVVPTEQRSFGLWVEQLIAESTGKMGKGIIPTPTCDLEPGDDRHVIEVQLPSAASLGAAFFRFELATAAAGHVLGIDPFDEPNVAESKANTSRVLSSLPLPEIASVEPGALFEYLEEVVRPGDYVSLQAYLPYGQERELEALRTKIRDTHHGLAVTAGYGPRFLHSTGQLHKGGPNSIVAIQIVSRSQSQHLEIPGERYDFATLIRAQAIGDHESLVAHGRRVLRISLDDLNELA
jgi:glucose-6-phosphate isomerase/transaldolase/glucose-6-phosphate isomerase